MTPRLGRSARASLALILITCGCGRIADQHQEEALIGSYNQDPSKVGKAQLILAHSGFDPAGLDGLMGAETRSAIKEFQRSRGLPGTGYLGDATWTEMMKIDRQHGPFSVERLQRALRNAGFDPGPVDGRAGYMTKRALSNFQEKNGLPSTGTMDAGTWSALKSHVPQQEPRSMS